MPSPNKTTRHSKKPDEDCLLTFIESIALEIGWQCAPPEQNKIFLILADNAHWGDFPLEVTQEYSLMTFELGTCIQFPPNFTQEDLTKFIAFINRANGSVSLGFFLFYQEDSEGSDGKSGVFLRYLFPLPEVPDPATIPVLEDQIRRTIDALYADADQFVPSFMRFIWSGGDIKKDRELLFLEPQGNA
jgi:hypothetical protein